MKQENKELLIKDLCARLPYGVKVKTKDDDDTYRLLSMHPNKNIALIGLLFVDTYATSKVHIDEIKPYLRPLSSMTEEEKKELLQISNFDSDVDDICYDSICCIERTSIDISDIANFISWLNAHHFDYHGLIPKGLAIAVTEDNNPYK